MKKTPHPYTELEGTELWKVVRKAVRELTKNGDLDLQTAESHVVGYLAKSLNHAGFRQAPTVIDMTHHAEVSGVPEKAGAA